jgi:coiled-coil domain-containing protein 130
MQGFNMGRYYPPDASDPPTFNASSHPLGKRANKISQGILTVRFELPFAVWCDHCKPTAIVGQGVRFNAEKKRVGNYHSTPIWSFRMKHSACGGWWEIRTDPQNTEYVVVEGVKKRDYGPVDKGPEAEGELKFLTEVEKEKRRNDAFASLEGKLEEKGTERVNKKRVEELYDKAEVWRDPYDVNARLRQGFRGQRKVWKKEERHKEGMQDKFSLGVDIVDETDVDRMRARLIDFGGSDKSSAQSTWRPLFAADETARTGPIEGVKKLKSEIKAEKSRHNLQQALVGNTRAAIDPFLMVDGDRKTKPSFGLLKRKREDRADAQKPGRMTEVPYTPPELLDDVPAKQPTLTAALLDYDSD